ncbi:defender against death DAD protein [Metschnikowia bicuspidata var. bicuspidata NRRL YB-4993]|uniref:Dolichyl-diphosphooligosaccharide--protein glycosyltransferase subunit OST2 n=1 Tax=Metschnikowia bicuspidata var. bicuspidata NRRL YB-4993 TaxID=869754 RepID=A0A1A0H9R3_9ASCO|nr:defender against death DAD protein [Metschnikowia bicuspidata var. bicuspidata NRRL YB-4993]OBA20735.1 defender against death DAD protein [Metschnikowia bicuspidata var. bicuspidata NRRL YB-4993]
MSKKAVAVKKAVAAVATQQSTQKDANPDSAKKPALVRQNSKLGHRFTDVANAVESTYNNYCKSLTPRLQFIDIFLVFLVALGVLQFVYVLLIGNFPFNAFLGGFIACVGQFVLTVSLRMHYAAVDGGSTSAETKAEKAFPTISPERAVGDYIFASLILHFIVFHFIN